MGLLVRALRGVNGSPGVSGAGVGSGAKRVSRARLPGPPVVVVVALTVAACGGATETPDGGEVPFLGPHLPGTYPDEAAVMAAIGRYLEGEETRRQVLVASLDPDDNAYAESRLANYGATESRRLPWTTLPELTAAVVPWDPGAEPMSGHGARVVGSGAAVPSTVAEWEALGRDLFRSYPAQPAGSLAVAARDPALRAQLGGWPADPSAGLGWNGLVMAWRPESPREPADGWVSYTCASCHRTASADGWVEGPGNATFDPGLVLSSPESRWPRGTVDVTPDRWNNPTAAADLRVTAFHDTLNWTGNVRNSLEALAVRIETQIITSNGERVRPSPVVAMALAVHIWSLSRSFGALPAATEGRAVWDAECAGCHGAEAEGGVRVPVATVGMPDGYSMQSERASGFLRPPSLRGLGGRGLHFHRALPGDLATLLSPPSGGVPEFHRWGRALGAAEADALRRWLSAL